MKGDEARKNWDAAWRKAEATKEARRLIVEILTDDVAGKLHTELAAIIRSSLGPLCDEGVVCIHRQDSSATPEWDHRVRSAEQAESRAGVISLDTHSGRWRIRQRVTTSPPSPTLLERRAIYRRQDLHEQLGGQGQGGISTPAKRPYILLFTGEKGRQYGYEDGWESDGTFHYTGEGQVGDMKMRAGNAAIAQHSGLGKDLELFETLEGGYVRYVGRMICAGFDYVPGMKDRLGETRTGIVFKLVAGEASEDSVSLGTQDQAGKVAPPSARPSKVRSLAQLRAVALKAAELPVSTHDYQRSVYERSDDVKFYVLARSKGRCEGCGSDAPFLRADDSPYLEPHHVERLSDGGPDHPYWVIALCPNCHRRAHYSKDSLGFNTTLTERARAIEKGLEQESES